MYSCFDFYAEHFCNMKKIGFFLIFFNFVILSCSQDNIYEDLSSSVVFDSIACDSTIHNHVANKWILKTMKLYYFWEDLIPSNMGDSMELPPDIFFGKLLNKKIDRFSWISKSETINNELLYGKIQNKGFEYLLFYSDTTMYNLTAEVIYTYPNSYAEKQGIKRGWFFNIIGGYQINIDNYIQLLSDSDLKYEFWNVKDDNTIDTTLINVKEEKLSLNPILKSTVISIDEHRVGYLCYRQFKADDGDGSEIYKKELLEQFLNFIDKGVDNLVLDLRYNSGGDIDLCVLLGSLIVPKTDTAQVALKVKYNKKLDDAYSSIGLGNVIYFKNNLSGYIGNRLDKIIILTGPNTASASEDVINMLLPYKKPILIGLTTYGKNYGSQSFISSDNNIKWVIQPITMKIYNGANESNFEKGFLPDYEIDENAYIMKEFGDVDEPLLAIALDVISNKKNTKKTTRKCRPKSSKRIFYNSFEKKVALERMNSSEILVVK